MPERPLLKTATLSANKVKAFSLSRARKHKLVEFSGMSKSFLKQKTIKLLSFLSSAETNFEYLDKLNYGDQSTIRLNVFVRQNDAHTSTTSYILSTHQCQLSKSDYYSSIYTRFKLDYRIHMSDEHFEENQRTHSQHQSMLLRTGIDTQFQLSSKRRLQLEATGQVLAYINL